MVIMLPDTGMEINATRRLCEILRRLVHCRSLAKIDSNELPHANAPRPYCRDNATMIKLTLHAFAHVYGYARVPRDLISKIVNKI